MSKIRAMERLTFWLGPWVDDTRRPAAVTRARVRVPHESSPGGAFDAWLYRPTRAATGAMLVVPGLHFLGPADPRLDRFCRVLANAGIVTLCPFLPTFSRLRVGRSLAGEATAAFDALTQHPACPTKRVGVFTISVGSYAGFAIAAMRPSRVNGLVVFGGYLDFERCLRFSLRGGNKTVQADPLNRPVAYLNLLPYIDMNDDEGDDTSDVARHITRYVEQTWGRPHMQDEAARRRVQERVEKLVAREDLWLFRLAIANSLESQAAGLAALEASDGGLDMDPSEYLPLVQCPVRIIHGRDDTVLPVQEAAALQQAMTGARPHADVEVYLTGLWGHTGSNGFEALKDVGGELRSMAGIVQSITDASHER